MQRCARRCWPRHGLRIEARRPESSRFRLSEPARFSAQVNMQYSGQYSGHYSGQYDGRGTQAEGRFARCYYSNHIGQMMPSCYPFAVLGQNLCHFVTGTITLIINPERTSGSFFSACSVRPNEQHRAP
jgi:hypothetical protein